MIFIGIDPGKKGGIARIDESDNTLETWAMPLIGDNEYDLRSIKDIIQSATQKASVNDVFGVIEKQHCMPGEGLPHTFTTGFGYGMLLGLFTALDVPYRIVTAKEWQKNLFKGLGYRMDTKVASILVAKRQFPHNDFRATERSKKDSDGLTDAANICVYAKKIFKNELIDDDDDRCVHLALVDNPKVCYKCGNLV